MAKVFWQQVRDNGYAFASVPAQLQADVKVLAKADVVSKVITSTQYKSLIGEKYEA